MADVAKKAMLLLMSDKCFDNYFQEFNFFDGKLKYFGYHLADICI